REVLLAGACALGTLVFAAAAARKLGADGLAAPFAVVVLFILMRRPLAMVALSTGAVILAEGPTFGLFSSASHLYEHIYRQLTPVDVLVLLPLVSGLLDVLPPRRAIRMPRALACALTLLALAMAGGAVVGHASGLGVRSVLFAENVLVYVLLLPVAVA